MSRPSVFLAGAAAPLDRRRRRFTQSAAWLAVAACGLKRAAAADVVPPPGAAEAALRALGAASPAGATEAPERVRLTLPDFIEDGASVPVTVTSTLSGVEEIYLLSDMNPMPIAAQVRMGAGTAARLSMRIKLAGSGRVYGVVRTADGLYWTAADAKVSAGGCS
jgi:sulfur-oxidizing protein SoxY